MPKELCDFSFDEQATGPLARTRLVASNDGVAFATARFGDVSRLAPRLPLPSTRTYQPRLPDGNGPVVGTMKASARFTVARSAWEFAVDGPLGWLAGARHLYSARARGFRMAMGVA